MAPNKQLTYHDEQNRNNILRLRELLSTLPPFCKEYFHGISEYTSTRTRLAYAYDLRVFFEFLHESNPICAKKDILDYKIELLDQITRDDILEYLSFMSYYSKDGKEITNEERGKKRKIASLRSFYKYFFENEKIKTNPASLVPVPKQHERDIIRLEPNEVATLLDQVEAGSKLTKKELTYHQKTKTRDVALLTLLLGTGIRVSECVGLDLNDVDFEVNGIRILRKGGKEAVVYFGDEARDALEAYLEERKKRDHRRLGKELELFMISDFGPGFPFWLPKGMLLKNKLVEFWTDIHTKAGYQFIQTPIMLNRQLWETSGHWFNYKENMYTSQIDENEFAIKPMNCPGGMLVYNNSIHSYRDFPLRLGELGLVHRHEASGALNGLFRVRTFTQDDAHIFMTEDQIRDEIANIILLYKKVYSVFNLKFHIELSTRPEDKYIGDIKTWEISEKALADACEKAGFDYKLNPGDGAFYGPKLDFKLRDSMNRIWQCGTIQLDMNLPERFDLTYVAEDGSKKRPVMVHRALFGSLERFIGILIEHYAGAFPTWLAPVQLKVIPVNLEYHKDYCEKLKQIFEDNNIRFELDYRDEKLGYKIREAQTKKIPYQLVVGDNEVKNNLLTYRKYGETAQTTVTVEEFLELLKKEISSLGIEK